MSTMIKFRIKILNLVCSVIMHFSWTCSLCVESFSLRSYWLKSYPHALKISNVLDFVAYAKNLWSIFLKNFELFSPFVQVVINCLMISLSSLSTHTQNNGDSNSLICWHIPRHYHQWHKLIQPSWFHICHLYHIQSTIVYINIDNAYLIQQVPLLHDEISYNREARFHNFFSIAVEINDSVAICFSLSLKLNNGSSSPCKRWREYSIDISRDNTFYG